MNPSSSTSSTRNGTFVPEPELALNSRTIAARKRNPGVQRDYIIPVLSKALSILDLLNQVQRPMNTHEIARTTGYSLTTVYRILRTLSAYGYLPEGCDGVYTFRRASPPEVDFKGRTLSRALPTLTADRLRG